MSLYDLYISEHKDDIIDFIEAQCKKYNIDESHDLIHAQRTVDRSREITLDTVLSDIERIIIEYACLLHDMCDKKYMDEQEGINSIRNFLNNTVHLPSDMIDDILFIVSTMSYSKIKMYGFPDFNGRDDLERCFHIVRNSDLLEGYDLERCIKYRMRHGAGRLDGIKDMLEVYKTRISCLLSDNLINIPIAKIIANELYNKCEVDIKKYENEIQYSFVK
jgi:hypothetical protein